MLCPEVLVASGQRAGSAVTTTTTPSLSLWPGHHVFLTHQLEVVGRPKAGGGGGSAAPRHRRDLGDRHGGGRVVVGGGGGGAGVGEGLDGGSDLFWKTQIKATFLCWADSLGD